MNEHLFQIKNACDLKSLDRLCPICKGREGFILGNLEYAHYDDCPLLKKMDVVSCGKCGFVYYDTPSTEAEYNDYYNRNAYYLTGNAYGMGVLFDGERRRYHETAEIIERHAPKPEKVVLDIGCGKGGMLQILNERGYGRGNLCGLDMLPDIVDYLNTVEGIRGYLGPVTRIPFEDSEVDVVILSHIVEHVINMKGAFLELDRVLSKNGCIYVEVPAAAHYPTFKEHPLFDFLFEHVNHFDHTQLSNMFVSKGFVMVEHGVKTIDTGCSKDNCIYGVFKRGIAKQRTDDHGLASHITRCFEMSCANKYLELKRHIESGKPIYVWGLSSYMMIMLAMSPLRECSNVSLLDKDTYKQQKTINGRNIVGPEMLEGAASDAVVVIPAGPYMRNMKDYAASIGLKGQLIVI